MKRKVCRKCKVFFEGDVCPIGGAECPGIKEPATNFQGRVFINDPEHSTIAKKMGFTHRGEYAVKVK